MNIITLDFETYFDDDYTLSKMSTEEYIRDPRFQAHGVAIRWPGNEYGGPQWYTPEEWDDGKYCKNQIEDWALLCHHTQFDGLILSHHYGIVPKVYLDTLSMARLMLGNHVSVSLDSVREHFGIPAKRTPYQLFKGKHWGELDQATRDEMAAGACDEVESIWHIFNRFMEGK